jgi:hypothetical protein
MTHQDLINGCFEALAGVMLWRNVLALYRAKEVRGVSVLTFSLFALWGFWNLYYYSSLQQWWSWLAGILVVLANTSWVLLAIYYRGRRRHIVRWTTEAARTAEADVAQRRRAELAAIQASAAFSKVVTLTGPCCDCEMDGTADTCPARRVELAEPVPK